MEHARARDASGAEPATSRAAAWVTACRPRTLPAGAVPVLVGTAHAYNQGAFAAGPAAAALAGALLIQVGTNLANDHFDHKKGADTAERAGPVRASASGLLDPRHVLAGAAAAFALAALVGVYLVFVGGWPILAVGIAGIVSGFLYTAGPRPLAYVGLGDLFAFLFFGPVAVMGTTYVQAQASRPGEFFVDVGLWMPALFLGIAVGALVTAILVVNNLRDLPTDARAGKRTLAVRIGARATRVQYVALLGLAYLLALLAAVRHSDWWLALPLASIVLAVRPLRTVLGTHADRSAYNPALGQTALLLVAYGVLYAAAMVVR